RGIAKIRIRPEGQVKLGDTVNTSGWNHVAGKRRASVQRVFDGSRLPGKIALLPRSQRNARGQLTDALRGEGRLIGCEPERLVFPVVQLRQISRSADAAAETVRRRSGPGVRKIVARQECAGAVVVVDGAVHLIAAAFRGDVERSHPLELRRVV